jgi:NAD(P)-dependent dehydrogenase (short-subunit alcohol dehydrogenase family)
MTGELRGKRALVTGASRGIGRAVADRLRAEGASVLSVARTTIETGDAETMVAADTCFRASSSPAWRASRASTPPTSSTARGS